MKQYGSLDNTLKDSIFKNMTTNMFVSYDIFSDLIQFYALEIDEVNKKKFFEEYE